MYAEHQIRKLVSPDDEAFVLPNDVRRQQLQAGCAAIEGMFWGTRLTLTEACETIIAWLRRNPMPVGDAVVGDPIPLHDE